MRRSFCYQQQSYAVQEVQLQQQSYVINQEAWQSKNYDENIKLKHNGSCKAEWAGAQGALRTKIDNFIDKIVLGVSFPSLYGLIV
ncbi:hypothetical protein FCV25MIE_21562 [Fagus crenata]